MEGDLHRVRGGRIVEGFRCLEEKLGRLVGGAAVDRGGGHGDGEAGRADLGLGLVGRGDLGLLRRPRRLGIGPLRLVEAVEGGPGGGDGEEARGDQADPGAGRDLALALGRFALGLGELPGLLELAVAPGAVDRMRGGEIGAVGDVEGVGEAVSRRERLGILEPAASHSCRRG
ncbi:MAG: hypothetical protein J0H08_13145, partial [Rhizobiales bacterium]|nr:hypothetical protein [Hyphomicrobiales bacterium]